MNLTFQEFIDAAVTPYQAVQLATEELEQAGFKRLSYNTSWKDITPGSRYYVSVYDTALFAFSIGESVDEKLTLFAAGAHTDHPGFRIKPNTDMTENRYLKLNTETYGGAILSTWLDRPLSVAGKITCKSDNIFQPNTILFDAKSPLLTIPSLAIHMNREVNKGVELNKQTQLSPLFSLLEEGNAKTGHFLAWLSDQTDIPVNDILDYDLHIYNAEKGCLLGKNKEFFSAPRLDNITSVYALLNGICHSRPQNSIHMIALYDNEEIGSKTKQSADSAMTGILLEKLFSALGFMRTTMQDAILRGIFLSVDVAHGMHPNYTAKNDPTNITTLGNGIVLKMNSSQRYATDTEVIAGLQQLCAANSISFQKFVNRSDGTPGGTLGSITSSWLPMRTADLGVPILAMHSARECMAIADEESLCHLMQAYFSSES